MLSFSELPQARKAAFAEPIVDKYIIEKMKKIPYRPVWENVAHPFDKLVASLDKKTLLICDTKAKAARTFYPDTGIDTRHYRIYKDAFSKYNLDTYLAFVDERAKKIYGQLLSILDQEREVLCEIRMQKLHYPRTENYSNGKAVRYFPLVAMEDIADLSDAEADGLKNLSTRNVAYDL